MIKHVLKKKRRPYIKYRYRAVCIERMLFILAECSVTRDILTCVLVILYPPSRSLPPHPAPLSDAVVGQHVVVTLYSVNAFCNSLHGEYHYWTLLYIQFFWDGRSDRIFFISRLKMKSRFVREIISKIYIFIIIDF